MLREFVAFARRDGRQPRKVDLQPAIDRAVALRRYYLSRGRVAVDVVAPPDGPLVVQADSQAVVQVLVNLVINAEEALAKQDVRDDAHPLVARTAASLTCEFVDSGAGLRCRRSRRGGRSRSDRRRPAARRAWAWRWQAPGRSGRRHASTVAGDAGAW